MPRDGETTRGVLDWPPRHPLAKGPALSTQTDMAPNADLSARIRGEAIAAVYGNAPPAASGALAGAAALAASIAFVDHAAMGRVFTWVGVLAAIAFWHIYVCTLYARAPPADRAARRWSLYLCAFYLAEGLVWGWAAAWLVSPDRLFETLLTYTIIGCVAAGSVTAIANYLPAFYPFFLCTLAPLVVQGLFVSDEVRRIASVYATVLLVTMLFLSQRVHRGFVRLVELRFEAEDLAVELRRQREVAETASLSKSRFLASASHDLRQPVHALGMFVGALKARAMDAEARRIVEHIEGSVVAMDDLFTSLLDISRLDAGVVDVSPKRFRIARLLERICREYEGEASAKGIALVWHPCSAVVRSDPVLLERVLRNLVGNAVRYTERGRVVVGCRRGAQLTVQVLDTGPGIPTHQQAAVFEEFYQLGNTERDRTKGLGLGLAIVKRLTKLLDATLVLRSTPGRGTAFSVTVPLAAASEDVAAEPEVGAQRAGLIVVVDDEQLVRQAMHSLLTSWGHTVIVAGSGDEMIAALADCPQRPDLIFCDYRLRDGETGVAVIQRLQVEYNEDIPGILITGDTAPDRLVEARASGFLLLHKPVADAKLRAAIGNLMRDAAAAEAADAPLDA